MNNEFEQKLTPQFKQLLSSLNRIREHQENQGSNNIHVNQSISSLAHFYEKLRNAVGYQQEQMLRRIAIERILRRKLLNNSTAKIISEQLIKELIYSGYIRNDSIPESVIDEATFVIDKYLLVVKNANSSTMEYIIGLLSVEIDSYLVSRDNDLSLVTSIYDTLIENYLISITEEDKLILISTLYRVFFKADIPTLRYYLLINLYPDWLKTEGEEIINSKIRLAENIKIVDLIIASSKSNKFDKLIKKIYPIYLILRKVIDKNQENSSDILKNQEQLSHQISMVAMEYVKETVTKLDRSIVKAFLFVLVTKVVVGFILEVPYDLYFYNQIHYVPILINLIFPPFLMYVSASLINIPGKSNTHKLIDLTLDIMTNPRSENFSKLVNITYRKRSTGLNKWLNTLYTVIFVLIVGFIVSILIKLNFNPISGILFFVFISTVSFLAFRIRSSTTELTIVGEGEGAVATFFDLLLLPFLRIGHWLSKRFEKYNIFLFLFDFILEAPFKAVLEIIEQLIGFVREKKDEMIN